MVGDRQGDRQMVSGPGRGGRPRAAHAYAVPPAQEEVDQQVQPLQQRCRFLLIRPHSSAEHRRRGRGGHADRPCPFGTTEARLPTATCGHPCRRGSSWPPRPRHHATTATTAIQTGSTAEHATTPEHPCPGVVARTGPQAVNPSPVSGESMASGGYACGRASHHQPHRGTPPTLPALQPEVATDPRWASLRQAAPGRLLPRGRTRTGL